MTKEIYCNVFRFNQEFAEMVKGALENGYVSTLEKKYRKMDLAYQIMLAANKLFAYACKGQYPEEDFYWIDRLCYENLVLLVDIFSSVASECEESMELYYQMNMCELSAKKAKELTVEDFIKKYEEETV